jgi:hypothetical protein
MWDLLKHLFIKQPKQTQPPRPKISDEERQANNDLIGGLRELEHQYKDSFLLKPEHNKTDDEIKKWAEEEVGAAHDGRVDNLTGRTEQRILNAENSFIRDKNSLVKRGLAHSSAFDERINSHPDFTAEELKELEQKHGRRYGALNAQIEIIQREFKSALHNFELRYASDLERRVAQLERDRDREASFIQRENERLLREFYANRHSPNASQAHIDNQKAMFEKTLEFYKSFNKDIALSMIYANINELAELIGMLEVFNLINIIADDIKR